MQKYIEVKHANENNLKNVSLKIPREKLVVFTGVSGSGKSTLAFDTIFAEGQRRYMESLSSYARMFLGQAQKPNVESIEGLSPAISIDQKSTSNNPRSTVGTVTEIYDYLRLLYARIGVPYCPNCGTEITQQTMEDILNKVLSLGDGTKVLLMAPIVRGEKGSYVKVFEQLSKSGYVRVKVDGEVLLLSDEIKLEKNKKHFISVIVDRLIVSPDMRSRFMQSLEAAIKLADGLVQIDANGSEQIFSTKYACSNCGFGVDDVSPRLFSFNNVLGACATCSGLGYTQSVDPKLIIKDVNKSLNEGAVNLNGWNMDLTSFSGRYFQALSKRYNFSLDTPFKDLPKEIIDILLYGNGGEMLDIKWEQHKFSGEYTSSYEGIIPNLERRFRETQSEGVKLEISKYMTKNECVTCKGRRLNKQALSVRIGGLNISELCDLSIDKIREFLSNLNLDEEKQKISESITKEINARLDFLLNVGLDYLTLSRSASTLSGGESQRIRLATQIGSGLTGVLYILDEPSIGLHQRDNEKLIYTMQRLRDMGNTLIVVEHDEDTIRSADYLVDIGPYAGSNGGNIVAVGTVEDIIKCEESLTGQYLSGKRAIQVPFTRRIPRGFITLKGARQNNLKNIDVNFPIGVFTCVTGVSGSGKSSLINELLYPILANNLNRANLPLGDCDGVLGLDAFDKVIVIDQSPIGKTPRSNPATYTGVFTAIRELFSMMPLSKERGYSAGRFSFNIKGGRCDKCDGDGVKRIEMFFLPDVYVPCTQCHGTRYNSETLEVKYRGKSIYEVLEMTVEEAVTFFANQQSIMPKLQALYDVGLGYIKLGQSATTLSGGEAQRVKLATELAKRSTGKTVYILDEPTTGLHSYDVNKLVNILNSLVNNGNTVIVIEHNLDVIKVADYIIDLGPEGGQRGGKIVVTGTPEEVANSNLGYTSKFLAKMLNITKNA